MNDAAAMTLALAEAAKGLGRTHPNPAVGAVIVKGDRVIGAGFTAPPGGPHAEARALAAAGTKARGATLYCTLEPCNHFGRTPPCSEAIIAAGIARVVFAGTDPNPHVKGGGRQRLEAAGIRVDAGLMAEASEALNRPFFKAMRTGLPWVTVKAGLTLDGKIAAADGSSRWITSETSRARVHRSRDLVDAIVVGAQTVLTDDPLLTTRLPGGGGRTGLRVVVDGRLRTSPRAAIYEPTAGRVVVATHRGPVASAPFARRGVEVWRLPKAGAHVSLEALLRRLVEAGALHVLVEGGAGLIGALLGDDLVDALQLYVAPLLFGAEGLTWSGSLPVRSANLGMRFTLGDVDRLGPDVALTYLRLRGPALAERASQRRPAASKVLRNTTLATEK